LSAYAFKSIFRFQDWLSRKLSKQFRTLNDFVHQRIAKIPKMKSMSSFFKKSDTQLVNAKNAHGRQYFQQRHSGQQGRRTSKLEAVRGMITFETSRSFRSTVQLTSNMTSITPVGWTKGEDVHD